MLNGEHDRGDHGWGNGNRPMHITIIADEPFPAGMAAANRIVSLARGFVECGADARVVLMRAHERPGCGIRNPDARGIIHGVPYEYACGTTVIPETFLARRRLMMRAYLRAASALREMSRNDGRKFLILYLSRPGDLILFYLLTRLFGIVILQDRSEYPFVLHARSLPGRIYAWWYTMFMFRLLDAMFVMTTPLERYFRPRLRRGARARLLHIPMTVETSRFAAASSPPPDSSPYVAYCGYIGGNKDGVPILLKAFALFSRNHPGYKLYIIGDAPDPAEMEALTVLALKLGIRDRVVFTGRVLRDEMPRYLCHASLLALARPSSLQSEGGFPTKLGEYLATGNPVVVTAVGDIPLYLRDGESSFISVPDSAEAFADKMEAAVKDRSHAREVGARGREVARSQFDYRTQAGRALQFLGRME